MTTREGLGEADGAGPGDDLFDHLRRAHDRGASSQLVLGDLPRFRAGYLRRAEGDDGRAGAMLAEAAEAFTQAGDVRAAARCRDAAAPAR